MLRLQEAGQFERPDDHVRNYRASLEADFQNKLVHFWRKRVPVDYKFSLQRLRGVCAIYSFLGTKTKECDPLQI
jgi:hypothetical protein